MDGTDFLERFIQSGVADPPASYDRSDVYWGGWMLNTIRAYERKSKELIE